MRITDIFIIKLTNLLILLILNGTADNSLKGPHAMEGKKESFSSDFIRESYISIIAQSGIVAAIFILYFFYPVTYIKLIAEDNWGGYATFAAHMLACFLFVKLFVSSKTKRKDFWYALFALGTFFIGMEEISWGQRIIGVGAPDFLRDVNFQGELTLHNIKAFSPETTTYLLVSFGCTVYGFILPAFSAISTRVGTIIRKVNLPLPSLHLAPLFLATSYFLKFSNLVKGEEIGEILFGISLGCLAVVCTLSKVQINKHDTRKKQLYDFAIPAYIAVSILIGVQLTFFWGEQNSFRNRLNQFAGERLPQKEHYRQAEAIFDYLERNLELADENLLINKGRFLRKTGREEEALTVFKEALDKEMKLSAENPNDPEMLRRTATIYSALGNSELSRVYLNMALEAYESALKTTGPQDGKKKRRTRPAWTYLIWSGKMPPKSELFMFHLYRAETYKEFAEYNKSIAEYLKGSEFASVAEYRYKIERGISQVLSNCRSGNARPIRRVPWNEVETMAKKLREGKSDWCGPTEGRQ